MDMWSIGCIIAELIVRRPIFPITKNCKHLTIIKQVIGRPSGPRKQWTRTYPKIERIAEFPDFLNQLIAFHPDERFVKLNYFSMYFFRNCLKFLACFIPFDRYQTCFFKGPRLHFYGTDKTPTPGAKIANF